MGHILHPDRTPPYISLLHKNKQSENSRIYKNSSQIEKIRDKNRERYKKTLIKTITNNF